jgi:hypothetical protein
VELLLVQTKEELVREAVVLLLKLPTENVTDIDEAMLLLFAIAMLLFAAADEEIEADANILVVELLKNDEEPGAMEEELELPLSVAELSIELKPEPMTMLEVFVNDKVMLDDDASDSTTDEFAEAEADMLAELLDCIADAVLL